MLAGLDPPRASIAVAVGGSATSLRRLAGPVLDAAAFDRSIDVHISNLRRKIDLESKQPSLIRSVRGAGYMLLPRCGS